MDADNGWQPTATGDMRRARPTLQSRLLTFVFALLFCRDALAGRRLTLWRPRSTPK